MIRTRGYLTEYGRSKQHAGAKLTNHGTFDLTADTQYIEQCPGTAPAITNTVGATMVRAGATGTYFWVDPSEALAVVFMAHAPGAIRFYLRQLLHALVMQALE